MPLIHSESQPQNTSIRVWQIVEDSAALISQLKLTELDREFLREIHPRRATEWAASRLLLRKMTGIGPPFDCLADEKGKPYIPGDPRHLSISHTSGMAAVALSNDPIGIDIQEATEKLQHIARKFVNQNEWSIIGEDPDMKHLQVIWGCKEAMFKLYGKGGVDFRKNLHVDIPAELNTSGHIFGEIRIEEKVIHCKIHYSFIESYSLVYAFETN